MYLPNGALFGIHILFPIDIPLKITSHGALKFGMHYDARGTPVCDQGTSEWQQPDQISDLRVLSIAFQPTITSTL